MRVLAAPLGFETLSSYFLTAKYLYVLLFLVWTGLLLRSRRPAVLLAGAIGLSLYAWVVLELPLGRLYAFEVPFDRMFNIAMAATAATGHSAFESYQVAAADLEPFWRLTMRLASLGEPANVLRIYPFLPPLVMIGLGLALYWGLGRGAAHDRERRWELALIVYSVLLLSSSPLEQLGVFGSFWPMNYLLKPNHVLGLILIALFVRAWTSDRPAIRTWGAAVILSGLAWVFLMHWSYLLAGMIALPLINRWQGRPLDGSRVALVSSVSMVAVTPYLWHLFANFYWGYGGAVAEKVWLQFGYEEGFFNFLSFTYEHGVLFLLSLLGIVTMARRRRREDALWLALLLGAVAGWAGYLVLFALQKIIEPDEFYFYFRFLLAVAAGTGAFSVLRWWGGLATSSVPACVFLLLTLPQSFPYWWDPPKMDSYYERSLQPIPEPFERLGAFLRGNTSPDAVLVASPETSLWIASLSGRRVLTTGDYRPTFDYEDRVELEEGMLERLDPASFREAIRRFHVSHLAVDADSTEVNRARLDSLPWLERIYQDGVVVYAIRQDHLPGADPP